MVFHGKMEWEKKKYFIFNEQEDIKKKNNFSDFNVGEIGESMEDKKDISLLIGRRWYNIKKVNI